MDLNFVITFLSKNNLDPLLCNFMLPKTSEKGFLKNVKIRLCLIFLYDIRLSSHLQTQDGKGQI